MITFFSFLILSLMCLVAYKMGYLQRQIEEEDKRNQKYK